MAATRRKKTGASDVAARARLLQSAADLFTRKGYAGTTVREIVAAADVTKPVLYYYFRSKEGIYLELMRGGLSRFDRLLEEAVSARGSAAERLAHLFLQVFDLVLERIDVVRLMYAIYYGPPQGAPYIDFDEVHRKLRDVVRGLVREGIRRGEFGKGDVDDMMWALVGALNVAMECQLCRPADELDREGLERVLRIICRGIGAVPRGGIHRRKGGPE